MSYKRFDQDEIDKLISLHNQTMSVPEIEKILNRSRTSIVRKLREFKLEPNYKSPKLAKRLTDEDKKKIIEMYNESKTFREIGLTIDCCKDTIANYLKTLGLRSKRRFQPIDMIDENNARCKKCNKIKPLNEFQYGRRGKDYEYRFSYCNECRKKQVYLNLNNDIEKYLKDRYNRLKRRALKNDILFDLTFQDFAEQFYLQKGKCFFTDQKMVAKVGNGTDFKTSMSIDKIVPELGYTKNNIVFCTFRANSVKSNLSLSELREYIPKWYNRIKRAKYLQVNYGDF